MIVPRNYQSESADKAISHMRSTDEPGILVLTTGAGKSVVTSLVAKVVNKSKKRVLCLSPNGDLASESVKKYRAFGENCSVFSASLNQKATGHPVVFGTPLSVVNDLSKFNDEYALLLIDECQIVNDDDDTTLQKIISHLKSKNNRLRILGLTATPMRGKEKLVGRNRTFKHIIHELPHSALSELGWVVPYELGKTSDHYEMAGISVQSNGKFKQSDIDAATLDKERLTRAIVEDAQKLMDADDRKCAMIFAASIKHGEEIFSYLPDGSAAFITGKTPKGIRRTILEEARHGKWKFLVTVTALGIGTDVPICDTVIFLRATESLALLLQFMGRGCRLYDKEWELPPGELNWTHDSYKGKKTCLVLDYAENLERFQLDDDLTITGLIDAKNKQDADEEFFPVACPDCGTENRHTAQRCVGVSDGIRCSYRFIFKECPSCKAQNSPSARNCFKCDAMLIDPDDKLTRKAYTSPDNPFFVSVSNMVIRSYWKNESQSLRVDYHVTDGTKSWDISEFLKPGWPAFRNFTYVTGAIGNTIDNVVLEAQALSMPKRLMVKKEKGSKYWKVVSRYNT